MFDSDAFGPQRVTQLRQQATVSPVEPLAITKFSLGSMSVGEASCGLTQEWTRRICRNRTDFTSCALLIGDDIGEKAYAFIYACQSP
eukprot:12325133-Heterocapsa_arctica.AAC.1